MTEEGYIVLARQALETVRQAINEAVETLPEEVYRAYWIAENHEPTPWDAVDRWAFVHGNQDQDVRLTVTYIQCLSLARQALRNITDDATLRRERPDPDLSLPRIRRTP